MTVVSIITITSLLGTKYGAVLDLYFKGHQVTLGKGEALLIYSEANSKC